MSTLNADKFVTPEQSMSGFGNASWGGVAVILHNGAVHRIVPPGKRFARGFRAPALGDLTFVEVNAQLIIGMFTLRDVPTRDDDFTMPLVAVEAQFRFDRAAGYARLEALVERFGPSFGEALRGEVTDQVDYLIRDRLTARSHDELFGRAFPDMLGRLHLPMPLGGGVYELFSVRITGVEYDQHYRTVRDTGAKIKAVQAGGAVDVASVQVEGTTRVALEGQNARVLTARFLELAPIAEQLGIPVEYLAYPERRTELEGRQFEFASILLDPGNRGIIARNPQLLESIQSLMGGAPLRRAQTTGAAMAPSGLGAAAVGNGGVRAILPDGSYAPDVTQPLPTYDPNTPEDLGAGAVDLTTDRRLARVWQSLGLSSEGLEGLAGATLDDRGAVLGVALVGGGGPLPAEAPAAFARVQRCTSTSVVVVEPGPLAHVVRQWLIQMSGDPCVGIDVILDLVDVDGLDALTISLRGRGAADIVRRLSTPDHLALPVLENLLPYGVVELGTAGS